MRTTLQSTPVENLERNNLKREILNICLSGFSTRIILEKHEINYIIDQFENDLNYQKHELLQMILDIVHGKIIVKSSEIENTQVKIPETIETVEKIRDNVVNLILPEKGRSKHVYL